MENRFDELTKALAEPIPRRQALRRVAGLFGAAVVGALALGGGARAASQPHARPGRGDDRDKVIPCSYTYLGPVCPRGLICVYGFCVKNKGVFPA